MKETPHRTHFLRRLTIAGVLVLALLHAASLSPAVAFGDGQSKGERQELMHGAIGLRLGGADFLRIADVLPDTPAWKAGLRKGDLLVSIDRVPTQDLSITQLIEKIRGRNGTIVIIEAEQAATRTKKTFEITRSVIRIPAN